jgi:hypothetical protein
MWSFHQLTLIKNNSLPTHGIYKVASYVRVLRFPVSRERMVGRQYHIDRIELIQTGEPALPVMSTKGNASMHYVSAGVSFDIRLFLHTLTLRAVLPKYQELFVPVSAKSYRHSSALTRLWNNDQGRCDRTHVVWILPTTVFKNFVHAVASRQSYHG